MKNRKGYADCLVTEGLGYSVLICLADDTVIEQNFENAEQLNLERLTEDVKILAKEMLENNNIVGNINVDFE